MATATTQRRRPGTQKRDTRQALDHLFPTNPGQRELSGFIMLERSRIRVDSNVREVLTNLKGLQENIIIMRDMGLGLDGSGILQPLIVTPDESAEESGYYRLEFGHRRFAATEVSHSELPVLVVASNDAARVVMQAVENIQRSQLSQREEVEIVRRLHEDQGMSIRDIGATMGESRRWAENRWKIARAGNDIQFFLRFHSDSPGATITNLAHIDKVADPGIRKNLLTLCESAISEKALLANIERWTQPKENAVSGPDASDQESQGDNQGKLFDSDSRREDRSQQADIPSEPSSDNLDSLITSTRYCVSTLSQTAKVLENATVAYDLRKKIERELEHTQRQLDRVRKALNRSS